MGLEVFLIIIGFFLLIKGADFLVDGASNIAKKFHIPEIVVGLTIVSIGTSMPELIVSSVSAIQGHSDIAIGNVVGSNIANLFLILGICAIIKPLEFKKQTRLIENPITLLVTVILLILCNNGATNETKFITTNEGFILLAICIVFIIYNIFMAKNGEKIDADEKSNMSLIEYKNISIVKSIVSVVIGIIALKFGGDLVVNNSVTIATMLGVSEKLISLTIIAFSTSLPELITSVIASKKGETDMAIGNILGSQIFNILLIIGVSAILNPIVYSVLYNKDIILLIIGTVMLELFPFTGKKNTMTRLNGLLFVLIYIIYMTHLVLN